MLKRVEILKQDNCFTYMLKRLGVKADNYNISSNNFIEPLEKHKIKPNLEGLSVGDVIVSYRGMMLSFSKTEG